MKIIIALFLVATTFTANAQSQKDFLSKYTTPREQNVIEYYFYERKVAKEDLISTPFGLIVTGVGIALGNPYIALFGAGATLFSVPEDIHGARKLKKYSKDNLQADLDSMKSDTSYYAKKFLADKRYMFYYADDTLVVDDYFNHRPERRPR
jgi:hypothetical protein